MAYDEVMDPFDCVEAIEQSLQSIHEIMASGGKMLSVNRIVDDVEAEARKREDHFKSGRCTGIPTGIKQLDKLTAGWQKGELIILAGRPSMGKTALMLHHAISSKANVCIYSLEMPCISLVNRMILFLCDLDADKFKAGAMSTSDIWFKPMKDNSANELTKAVIRFIRLSGGQAERISVTGRTISTQKTYTDVLGHRSLTLRLM